MSDGKLKSRIRRSQRKAQKKKQRMYLMAGAACAVVLAVIGIVYGVMYSYVNQYPENRILDHVFIGTQDVSGMTKKEAVQAIQSHHEEHLNYKVTMKVGEESAQATLAELGLEHRGVDQLVESAMDYGKKGPLPCVL